MPDVRIDNPDLGPLRPGGPGGDASSQTGVYNGAKVVVIDQNSLIADAAEELTESFSEDTEKDVSEREVESGRREDSLKRLLRLQEVAQLSQKFGDLDQDKLERTLRLLLQQRSSARQFREKSKEAFKDAAHQYVLLKALALGLRERGAPDDQIAAADAALAELSAEGGAAVQAAINVAEVASDFALEDLGAPGPLRSAYHQAARNYQSMASALDDLIERFGPEDLEKSICFMEAALAADLDAAGPSAEPAKLQVILDDMHRLEALATIKGNCDGVMRVARLQGARQDADGVWLLKEIAELQDARVVHARDIEKMPANLGLADVEREIRFLNDFIEVARDIPLKSYAKPENRRKLIDAAQQVLDAAIEREENELEEDES